MDIASETDSVYDLATEIGHDFEKLVQTYGYDAFAIVLPKVVRALENLETSMKRSESVNIKLNEMRLTLSSLERERNRRQMDQQVFEKVFILVLRK